MVKKPKKKPVTPAILNRRARFDYDLGDEITVGVSLTGPEVRAARDNRVQLRGAYVTVRDGELWLNNASFSLHTSGRETTVDSTPRKLLAKRREIEQLAGARDQQGMTIVPVRLLTHGRFIKLVVALGRGKKHYDKRETIKRRETEREARRAIKHRG